MNYMTILIFIIGAALLSFIVKKWIQLRPYNQKPLSIKTFDGFNSPYHPSVTFFPNGWNGWKYWMAETPFSPKSKPYRDRNECPSIHVSNNGIDWTEPTGLRNPIVDLSAQQIKDFDYYSDPQLLVVDNHLELFFRHTRRHGNLNDFSDMTIYRVKSDNGIDWSETEEVIKPKMDMVSPGMTYDREKGFRLWYVDSESHHGQRNIAFISSPDCKSWSKPKICTLSGYNVNPWHIDVQEINAKLFLTVYDYQNISIWEGKSDNPIMFRYMHTIIKPAIKKYGSFYCNGLYRACLVKTDKGYELFYSGDDSRCTYLGLMMATDNRLQMKHSGPKGCNSNFVQFLEAMFYGYKRWISFVVKNQFRRL